MAIQSNWKAPFSPGGETEIDSTLATRLLVTALESGGDYADLFFEYRHSADYVYEEQRVKSVGQGIIMGLGVRVVKGDATGYAYAEDFTWESMSNAARIAGQIARGGAVTQPQDATLIGSKDVYPVQIASLAVPAKDKLQMLRDADTAARAADSRVCKVEASFSEQWKEILVVTSDGVMGRDRQPMIRMGVRAMVEDKGKRQAGSSGGGGRHPIDYFYGERDAKFHGRESVRLAVAMLDAQEAPAGEFPVVLAAGDSGILLHEAVGHGLEADFNRKQTSNYSGQVGKMVASKLCTVVDDGTVTHSRGSINIDDEGNVPNSNVLIENGKLVGYMHDRLSAKHFGIGATGNGRRQSFRCMPLPRMTNTSLLGGDSDPQELLAGITTGIFAKRFSGGQVNISNGDFVFSLTESYLIENGKLTAPLKGVNLIGNGPDVLRDVSMVGNDYALSDGIWTCGKDGQSVPVGVGTPSVKIDKITVGGTKQ